VLLGNVLRISESLLVDPYLLLGRH
jgi:hypothetical protein